MSLSSHAFIDRTYFNSMSGESISAGSADETKLFNLINFSVKVFDSFCKRKLKARDFSYVSSSVNYDPEYSIFNPPIGDTFWFPTYPVNSLTTFIISSDTITEATDYDDIDGYYLYKHLGKLVYEYGFDPGYNKNIKAVWNGGYNSTNHPDDYASLQYLQYCFVKELWSSVPGDDRIISESIGNYRYTLASPDALAKFFGISPVIFHNLSRFKREVIA